jgi:uncharacterized protein HemX
LIKNLQRTSVSKKQHEKEIAAVKGQCGLDCSSDSQLVANLKDALTDRDTKIKTLEKELKDWDRQISTLSH